MNTSIIYTYVINKGHLFMSIFLSVHFAFFFTKNNEFLQVLLKANRVGMVSLCNYFLAISKLIVNDEYFDLLLSAWLCLKLLVMTEVQNIKS